VTSLGALNSAAAGACSPPPAAFCSRFAASLPRNKDGVLVKRFHALEKILEYMVSVRQAYLMESNAVASLFRLRKSFDSLQI
jgi:hypothetical protein